MINSVFKDPFTGLGHSANFYGPDLDSIYTSYHCHAPEQTGGGLVRWYCLDRLLTNGGWLYTTGPSDTAMPLPDQPDVRRIISRRRRTICINLAARPGAKIDQLLP